MISSLLSLGLEWGVSPVNSTESGNGSVGGEALSEDFPALLAGFRSGALLAGYRLEAQVGAGGMAVVFRARDEHLDRLAALKVLAPALATDEQFRLRFIAESRAAAAVDDPFIIPVYEAGEAGGVLFIAMRFVRGGDLHRVLEREGTLSPGRAAEFISPVASALDAAHRAGLVHRDVKPGNILIDAREDRPDHVYLSDFGVAKAISSEGLTGPGFFVGTPSYAAPEQIQGRAVDGRADQYALACVAFQLLTGALPFREGQDLPVLLAHVSTPAPSLTAQRPDLSGAVDQVMARAMAKDPEERYASCLDFAGALREALGLPPFDPEGPVTPRSSAPVLSPPETVTLASTGAVGRRRPSDAGSAPGERSLAPRPRSGITDRSGRVTAWARRHRLPVLAVTCVSLAAVAVIAIAAAGSPAKRVTPAPANLPAGGSQSPATSASPPVASSYSHVALKLPAPYAGTSILSLAFSPSGTKLAITSLYVCVWNIASTGCTIDRVLHGDGPAAFRPDGKTVAVGGPGVSLMNAATGTVSGGFTDPGGKGVNSVAFSPDGKLLAAGDFNGRAYLWDVATGKLARPITATDSKSVNSVAFSPDGKVLAVGDFSGHIYLWDVATAAPVGTPITDPGSKGVNAVAFAPDGRTLAVGDQDGSSYLWDVATGNLTATLPDTGSAGVRAVAFGPGGNTLATGDGNGGVNLWRVG